MVIYIFYHDLYPPDPPGDLPPTASTRILTGFFGLLRFFDHVAIGVADHPNLTAEVYHPILCDGEVICGSS